MLVAALLLSAATLQDPGAPEDTILALRVEDREGAPRAGRTVILNWRDAEGRRHQERAVTGGRGRVRLELPSGGRLDLLEIRPRGGGRPDSWWRIEGPRPLEPGAVLRFDLREPEPGGVSGLALDASGAPAADAWVTLEEALFEAAPGVFLVQPRQEVLTAGGGRFHFEGVAGRVALSAAWEPRTAVERVAGRVRPGEEVEGLRLRVRDLRLPLTLRLVDSEGHRLDVGGGFVLRLEYLGDGRPPLDPGVPGFHPERRQPWYLAEERDGTWYLDHLVQGAWEVRVTGPLPERRELRRRVEPEEEEVVLRLPPGGGSGPRD